MKRIQRNAVALLLVASTSLFSQNNNVGVGTATPDPNAILDLSSTSQGFLPPRMTEAERDAISTPITAGLVVWCANCGADGELQVFNGTDWTNMVGGIASVYTPVAGDVYQGGIIAYIFQSGDPGYVVDETHGMIVHPQELSSGIQWGPSGPAIPGLNNAIGMGEANTAIIVAATSA